MTDQETNNDTKLINNNNKIIFIPQGHCGKITPETLKLGITGLYTDNFTSCIIIICIGKDKLSLTHLDFQNHIPHDIKQQIQWTSSDPTYPCRLVIYSRKKGEALKKSFLQWVNKEFPSQKIIDKIMDDEHEGILLSLNKDQLNPITKLKNRPLSTTLLHHPQEQRLLTIRKIEQVIGQKASLSKFRYKQAIIFDEKFWEIFTKVELEIDLSHPTTQKELKSFSDQNTFMEICYKLGEYTQALGMFKLGMDDFQNWIMPIAIWMEDYLNDYNYELAFQRNLLESLKTPPSSLQDKNFQTKMNELLLSLKPEKRKEKKSKEEDEIEKKRQVTSYNQIQNLVEEYKKDQPIGGNNTVFKLQFLDGFKLFSEIYERRVNYQIINEERMKMKTEALKQNAKAISYFKKTSYKEAEKLFREILQALTYSCLKNEPELASIYYNLGKCLLKSGDSSNARIFLDQGLKLKTNFTIPKPSKEEIKKMKEALLECRV